MWRFILLGVLAGLLLSVASLAMRQSPQGELNLQFRDSLTGVAVPEVSVDIESFDASGSRLFATLKGDAFGRASGKLPLGRFRLTARTTSGDVLLSETVVSSERPTELVFHFDPTHVPLMLDPKWIKSQTKSTKFLVTGVVVHDQTGKGLSGVSVQTPLGSTISDGDGFFQAWLPLEGSPVLTISGSEIGTLHYKNFETWPGGDIQIRARLNPGNADRWVNLREERRRTAADPMEHIECDSCTDVPGSEATLGPRGAPGPALPKSIRVGRNCPTSTTCSSVEVYTLDTYTARVLSSEWYGCWGSVTGGMDAMRAGAVAVRSYGTSFVYSPRTSTYDICDTTSCQVFGSTTNTNSVNGTNETATYVLTTSSGSVARSEYSAENNDSGCGNGFTGTGSSAPCISDPVCTGFASFGHGRGLCQWGSARWSTQKVLSSSLACSSSAPATGQARKDWVQILAHYYTTYSLVQGAALNLTGVAAVPSTIGQGGTTLLNYALTSPASISNVWLIATLSLNGTGSPITNTANQVRVNVGSGSQVRSRSFATNTAIATGSYTVVASMLFDRDSSNTVNTGDFLMADRSTTNGLTVSPSTILAIPGVQDLPGASVSLNATLTRGDTQAPVSGRTVGFSVDGNSVGTAVTNAAGLASLPYILGSSLGSSALVASFSGDGTNGPATANSLIWRVSATALLAGTVTGRAGSAVLLTTRITSDGTTPLIGRTVTFRVSGVVQGTAVSDSRGLAKRSYTIPGGIRATSLPVQFEHPESLPYLGSSAPGSILVTRRPN